MTPFVVLEIVLIVAAVSIIAAQHLVICHLQKRLFENFWKSSK